MGTFDELNEQLKKIGAALDRFFYSLDDLEWGEEENRNKFTGIKPAVPPRTQAYETATKPRQNVYGGDTRGKIREYQRPRIR